MAPSPDPGDDNDYDNSMKSEMNVMVMTLLGEPLLQHMDKLNDKRG
jgi:hypothetical protein